jgi:hypothetical protein
MPADTRAGGAHMRIAFGWAIATLALLAAAPGPAKACAIVSSVENFPPRNDGLASFGCPLTAPAGDVTAETLAGGAGTEESHTASDRIEHGEAQPWHAISLPRLDLRVASKGHVVRRGADFHDISLDDDVAGDEVATAGPVKPHDATSSPAGSVVTRAVVPAMPTVSPLVFTMPPPLQAPSLVFSMPPPLTLPVQPVPSIVTAQYTDDNSNNSNNSNNSSNSNSSYHAHSWILGWLIDVEKFLFSRDSLMYWIIFLTSYGIFQGLRTLLKP